MFCTKCNNNWASLHSFYDEEQDENYEFCPVCKTDMFLVYSEDGKAICCPITGVVKNGVEIEKQTIIHEEVPKIPNWLAQQMKIDKEREIMENKALEKYFDNCEKLGEEQARKVFSYS